MKTKEMKIEQLNEGDTIENNNKYNGEGEYIVAEINKNEVKCIHACSEKYPSLNGQTFIISKHELQYYHKIN